MKAKPSIKSLVVESHKFFMDNFALAKDYAMPLVIPLVILTAVINIGGHFSEGFQILEFVSIYFISCFTLAWHRAFLLGPKPDYAVNPFALKPGEGKFILVVYLLSLAPIAVLFVGGVLFGFGVAFDSILVRILMMLLGAAAIIGGIAFTLRWLFILPARSVNAQISLSEASRLSRGLVLRLLGTILLFTLVVFVAIFIPIFIVTLIANLIFGEGTLLFTVFMTLLVYIPCIAVTFYTVAVGVGVLSRLYQWSVQERG